MTDTDTVQSEDTPDLLDSNTLKPVQGISDCDDENLDVNKQLPDITSVRSIVACDEIPDSQPVFDLIKPHVSNSGLPNSVSCNSDELPPIVTVEQLINEEVLHLQIQPISFEHVDDVSEAEVEDYLNALEVEECSEVNVEPDKDIENTVSLEADEQCQTSAKDLVSESVSSLTSTFTEMGLTGSSSKSEKSIKSVEIGQKQEPGEAVSNVEEYNNTSNPEKKSLLQEFPSESGYSNKKCELDNINSRSCTNHSTDSINITESQEGAGCSLPIQPNFQQLSNPELKCGTSVDIVLAQEGDSIEVSLDQNCQTVEDKEVSSDSIIVSCEETFTEPDQSTDSASSTSVNIDSAESLPATDSSPLFDSPDGEDKPIRPSSLPIAGSIVLDSEESPTPTNVVGNTFFICTFV